MKVLTYFQDDRRLFISRKVPEHDVNGHGTEQQRHTAGDPLHAGEGAAARRVHDRHPDVLVAEAG